MSYYKFNIFRKRYFVKKSIINSKMQSELAMERTKMANRRTLLAYIRSAVGFVVAGAGLLKFIQDPIWIYIGIICIILAPITIIAGIIDYRRVNKLIEKEAAFLNSTEEHL